MVKVEEGMFYKKSIFITLAVIVSLLSITIGWFIYKQEINESWNEAKKDVKAIGELKTKQIADWYEERINEIEIRTISPYLPSAVEKLLEDGNNIAEREKVYRLLKAHKRQSHFDEIMLSTKNGKLLLATSPGIKKFDTTLIKKINLTVKNKTFQISDIYFNNNLNKAVIDFLSPIFNEEKEVIAVMIFRINPEDYLFPFLQSWLPTVKTFETLLVRRDGDNVIFLNELKFKKNTALKLKYPMQRKDVPAVIAVLGHKGIFEGNDYRGIPVIAYLSHIPGTKWYLVTKIDKSELLSDSLVKSVTIILFVTLFIVSIILLFFYLYNNRQKHVYKKLFEAETEFETTLNSIGDAVITTDKSGNIRYMNPVAESLTGWTEKEAIGNFIEKVFKIINEETRAKVENPVEKVLREGLVVGLANHTLLISKDGIEIPIADSGAPIKDENGEIIGVVLVFRDQSDERAMQKLIISSEEKFRQIFESANVGKSITNPSGKINVNKAFCDMLGYRKEELENKTWQELTPSEEVEIISSYISPLLEGKKDSVRFDKRYIHKNGSYIWCDVSTVLRRDENGNPLHFITTIVDINEKRKIESEKQLFSKVLENTLNEIYIFDDKTLKFINVNLGARENLGYSMEELKNMTPIDIKPELTEQKFREMIKPLLDKEIDRLVFETVHERKDGSLYPVEVFLYYRKTEGMLTAIINDITERKRDEEALKQSEALYRTTLYSIGDAVITTDTEGMIMQLNTVAEELTGWKEADAKGKPLEEVFKIISEIDRKKVENPVEKVLREGLVVGLANHTLLISKDGIEIPIADSGAPIKDENGEIIGVVLVFRDQTEERYTQKILAARLKIIEETQNKSLHDIFQSTLDEIGNIVNSPIGFYHMMLPDQETLCLQAWSTRTEKEFCKAEGKGLHYNVSEAGVWVDCVHQKKPVIHNDYESLPHKKGLPEGHAPVIRELVVPIMRQDNIVAVLGVGNKPSLYTQNDLETVSFLADVLWEVVEKKIAEEKLIENEKRNRYISGLMSDIAYSCKHNEKLVYEINWMEGAVESITGYTFDELLAMKCWGHIVIEDDFPIFKKHVLEIPAGEEDTCELRIKRKDGEIRWISSTSKCISDEISGNRKVLYGGLIDITQRKASEIAIKESEEKYRKLIEISPDGIIIHQKGIIKYANHSAVKIGGYDSAEELIGRNAIEFVHPDYREMALRRIQDAITRGEIAAPMEEKFVQKDGKTLDVEVTAVPFVLNNEAAVQTIIRDISERKKKEAELFETKNILEKIYLGINDGIVIIDSKTKNITGCNYAAERIFRYPYKEILDKHISLLLKDNEQINFKEIASKFSSGEEQTYLPVTGVLQRKDNLLFPATFTVFPLSDKNNMIIRFVLIVRDISEEIKQEQERKMTNQRLKTYATHLQSVREEERTSIAREIHDEIGQALSVMNMNLSILERDYLVNTENFKIDEIKNEITNLKNFIIKTVGKMRKVIMNLRPEVIEDLEITEAIDWLINEFRKDNHIDCIYKRETERIEISKDKTISLFRIVQEALRNVAQHSGASQVEIIIRKQKTKYELIISDNGIGFHINEINYKKSFGLTGIKERVEILDGTLEVISEQNKGTKIIVKFN